MHRYLWLVTINSVAISLWGRLADRALTLKGTATIQRTDSTSVVVAMDSVPRTSVARLLRETADFDIHVGN